MVEWYAVTSGRIVVRVEEGKDRFRTDLFVCMYWVAGVEMPLGNLDIKRAMSFSRQSDNETTKNKQNDQNEF